MQINTILFDLDGTLLPMDQDAFAKAYIKGLALAAIPYGYDPNVLSKAILDGTAAMVKNTGSKTNEEVFWDTLANAYGETVRKDICIFDEFYQSDFQKIQHVCGFTPKADRAIKELKKRGFRLALATNPLFPAVATESRIRWAGLDSHDFELITTYETSHYCKPNLDYYREMLDKLAVCPEECLMVGNDVSEDMIAEQLGMKVFLLTDCLINKMNSDISVYLSGNFDDLLNHISSL